MIEDGNYRIDKLDEAGRVVDFRCVEVLTQPASATFAPGQRIIQIAGPEERLAGVAFLGEDRRTGADRISVWTRFRGQDERTEAECVMQCFQRLAERNDSWYHRNGFRLIRTD